MQIDESLYSLLRYLIAGAIFFVWIVRYQNIVEEFKFYKYPNWLRDLVGILKVTFAIMLLSSESLPVTVGSIGISILMLAAIVTHIRVKNPIPKMLPSLSLFFFSLLISQGT